MLQHIEDLSADSMEGRAPGGRVKPRRSRTCQAQFKSLGLEPGNPDGTYLQNVDLIGFTSHPTASFSAGGKTLALKFPTDFIANSRHERAETKVDNSDVVFVGYGVVAPEYGWDDYKGVDVRGKTIVMLVNDPPVPDPERPGELDPTMFEGSAMTYYGRWTYKYEIACGEGRGGARSSSTRPARPAIRSGSCRKLGPARTSRSVTPDENMSRAAVEGWISLEKAKELFADGGPGLRRARRRRPRRATSSRCRSAPRPRFDVTNTAARRSIRRTWSRELDGADPKLRDEYVVYTAHWDHLGRDPALKGDQIFNGAADNASGVAALLEIAEAFTRAAGRRAASILFLAVTAEEKGLLGVRVLRRRTRSIRSRRRWPTSTWT